MDFNIRWPKKGDNPFSDKSNQFKSPTFANLEFLKNVGSSDTILSDAFKESADKIISELRRGEDPQHPDKMFMPIAYLYRHCLELKLKLIVQFGIDLEYITEDEKVNWALRNHHLHRLWNLARKVLNENWPEGPIDDLNAAEKIIVEFHKIDQYGSNLRYSKDSQGNRNIEKLPKTVDLLHLKDVFNAIFNFLDGSQAGLDEALSCRRDMMSDMM